MNTSYCIYKDESSKDLSPEHIIPLSLGGCNEFCIDADRILNNLYGTAIDRKFANTYYMSVVRQQKGYLGHSKKPADPIIKNIEKKMARMNLLGCD